MCSYFVELSRQRDAGAEPTAHIRTSETLVIVLWAELSNTPFDFPFEDARIRPLLLGGLIMESQLHNTFVGVPDRHQLSDELVELP